MHGCDSNNKAIYTGCALPEQRPCSIFRLGRGREEEVGGEWEREMKWQREWNGSGVCNYIIARVS